MEDRSVEVLAVAIAFFVLCWAAVLLRVYCRALVLRSLGADDSLMAVSWAVFTGYLICILLALKFGAGKHHEDIDPGNYTTALKTLHVIATAYHFLLAFQCAPVSTFWNESPRAPGRCLDQGLLLALTYAASAVNAAADWAFGVLPFFIVWSLSLPLRTRTLAVGILSLAAVGSAATIVRAVYIPRLVAADDFLWSTADVALCAADDYDDVYPPYYQQGGRHQQQHHYHSRFQSRPSQSLDVPRSHFSSPSSPEERGANAGLWGGRHSRPRVPTLTLSWLFSPLANRIANGGGSGTPRISAISFGGWGGAGGTAPRSEGAASRSSVAAAAAMRSKSSASQRSGRSASLGSFRSRPMADYTAPVPNLPLRYLRQTRRERSAAATEQGGGAGDGGYQQVAGYPAADGLGQAMPMPPPPPPLAAVGGAALGRDRMTSGAGGSDASGSSMATRTPARKKRAVGMGHNYI
ncbi:integral membrane protein [Gaeumannomyces tritici R3-111a-1]|uniref:Integral membrane protein n=1 Tax=Gaeumannomyces tritici (strain R3-111a-1) TaxID=644352 RepID=J3NYM0_GAET3|nr:integral membrane protein [Gaeumannomyces tritici R3-111a-1]EJT76453.1 integral membrane protein [Gaeumannomyces tritici R3-111a-1]